MSEPPAFDTPVLFLIFNRPAHTARSFAAIRERRPTRLFIAADGPRENVPTDAERTAQARAIALNIDWPCEVTTLLRDSNLGCAAAISQAITWFFFHVESGIILEDDCIPSPAFWDYTALMLDRYRDHPTVMCVSGNNFLPASLRSRAPYYFSRYPNIWGWATWARAWAAYATVPPSLSDEDLNAGMRKARIRNPLSRYWWRRTLSKYVSPTSSTWDYRWTFSIWMHDGFSVSPNRNLVANVGFDIGATHGGGYSPNSRFTVSEEWDSEAIYLHSADVKINRLMDTVYDLYVITYGSLLSSVLRRLTKSIRLQGHR